MPAASAVASIRAARARSNDAIARHDVEAIMAEMDADVQITVGSGAFVQGRQATRQAFASQFEQAPDARYVRTPEAIRVAEAQDLAFEAGTWVATWTDAQGPVRMEGPYAASWRLTAQGWKTRAELFVTLKVQRSGT